MITISLNGENHTLADGQSLADVLNSLDLGERRVAVVRNGDVISRAEHAATLLAEGDAVEVIHMVGGG